MSVTGRTPYEPPMYFGVTRDGKYIRLIKTGGRWHEEPRSPVSPTLYNADFSELEMATLRIMGGKPR